MTRMTPDQVKAFIARDPLKGRKTKFRNIRCTARDGSTFGSVLEKDYYEQLVLLWYGGEVLWFTRQVPFWLEGGVKYVVDFMFATYDGGSTKMTFVDTTGVMTQVKKNKLKQLRARYGIEVQIVTRDMVRYSQ